METRIEPPEDGRKNRKRKMEHNRKYGTVQTANPMVGDQTTNGQCTTQNDA